MDIKRCAYEGENEAMGSCSRETRCCQGCWRVRQCEKPCPEAARKSCGYKNDIADA